MTYVYTIENIYILFSGVNDEPGRVANVFKGLMREDLEFMG